MGIIWRSVLPVGFALLQVVKSVGWKRDDWHDDHHTKHQPREPQGRGAAIAKNRQENWGDQGVCPSLPHFDRHLYCQWPFEAAIPLMISRSLVLGYHGCDQTVVLDVVSGRARQFCSTNDYDWLGSGIYFWEDSYDRAFRWAQDEAKRDKGKIKTPAVLGAVIDLGKCLNLIDSEHLDIVKSAHSAYLEFCKVSGLEPARNRGRDLRARFLDHAVLETLHRLRKQEGKVPFDSVRAFFVEGEPLYENAGLRSLDHIQICVRELRQIVGCFLPRIAG